VEINVVDPILRKCYRFKGRAVVHRAGPVYDAGLRFYRQRGGLDSHRIDAIVLVRIEQVTSITSPAYDDGTSEQEVEQRSLLLYRLTRTKDL
jgi:hypothetical protein